MELGSCDSRHCDTTGITKSPSGTLTCETHANMPEQAGVSWEYLHLKRSKHSDYLDPHFINGSS